MHVENRERSEPLNELCWHCIWQARIAELEEELEAERAGRTKASNSRLYFIILYTIRPIVYRIVIIIYFQWMNVSSINVAYHMEVCPGRYFSFPKFRPGLARPGLMSAYVFVSPARPGWRDVPGIEKILLEGLEHEIPGSAWVEPCKAPCSWSFEKWRYSWSAAVGLIVLLPMPLMPCSHCRYRTEQKPVQSSPVLWRQRQRRRRRP